jgi:hypothetical protein
LSWPDHRSCQTETWFKMSPLLDTTCFLLTQRLPIFHLPVPTRFLHTISFAPMARTMQENKVARVPSTIVPTVPSHPHTAMAVVMTLSYIQCTALLEGKHPFHLRHTILKADVIMWRLLQCRQYSGSQVPRPVP